MSEVQTMTGVEVVRAYCDAWLVGDAMAVLALYHDDLTLIWPGRHRLAGTHVGQQASVGALLDLQSATNRVPVEIVEVMPTSEGAVSIVLERWSREADDGATEVLEHRRVLEYSVVDGRLHTCRVYESAPSEVDDWLASLSLDIPSTG